MTGKPIEMPPMNGMVFRNPCVTPEASAMTLFGPGVAAVTNANAAIGPARSQTVVIGHVRASSSSLTPSAPNSVAITRSTQGLAAR